MKLIMIQNLKKNWNKSKERGESMTKEEAVKEIEKAFEPAFANYIITALTEGTTVSDKALKIER